MYMCIKPCEGFKDGDKCVVLNLSSDNHQMILAYTGLVYRVISWSEFKECFVEID